jgi:cation diffusion facilitator family transporter
MSTPIREGIRTVRFGILANTGLALVKGIAGVLGNSYALIADAVESFADMFSSLVVWGGLRISARPADEDYPFGYGKAEAVATAVVGLVLIAAAIVLAYHAVGEIVTPHHAPAPFTLVVLVGVVIVKELLFRRVKRVGDATGSIAVRADAWHHRSDAITSAAAFVGISVALIGGPGWEQADDWAAIVAAAIILVNGGSILRPALADLMDRAPQRDVLERVGDAAAGVPGVKAIEKLAVRKTGLTYYVDIHVQADPELSLHDAHILSGMVKGAIRAAVPEVAGALVHMEPYEAPSGGTERADAYGSSSRAAGV